MSAEVIEKYFRSVNTEDWALMAGIWHSDGRLKSMGKPEIEGLPAILEHYPRVLSGYPEHVDTPTRVLTVGDTVVVEIAFVGRLADGRPIEFEAVDVFDLREGRIARLTTWYDSYTLMKKIREGASPVI